MANHSGTISSNETWALVDSPHHITGNITINNGVTLTREAGVNIYYDGNYNIGCNGSLSDVGTALNKITCQSNSTNQKQNEYNSYAILNGTNTNNLQHIELQNSQLGFCLNGTLISGTFKYLHSFNNTYGFYMHTSFVSAKIEQSKVEQCYYWWRNTSASALSMEFEFCVFEHCGYDGFDSSTNCSIVFVADRCLMESSTIGSKIFTYGTFDMDDCIIKYCFQLYFSVITNVTIDDTIIYRNSLYGILFAGSSDGTLTNLDIIGCLSSAILSGGGLNHCHIAGNLLASEDNVDTSADGGTDNGVMDRDSTETPQQYSNVDYNVDNQASLNQAKAISAEASTPSTTSCVITFTSGRRGTTLVKWGTVSGTYTHEKEIDLNWTDLNEEGEQMTRSHSITISGLQVGTVYYYKCYSQDALGEWSESSSELSFTTTGAIARVTNFTISTNDVAYPSGGSGTISANITLDKSTTATDVVVTLRESDGTLVHTLLITTYNSTANIATSLDTINGSALSFDTDDGLGNYYIQIVISGGTPVIDSTVAENTFTAQFGVYSATLTMSYDVSLAVTSPSTALDISTPSIDLDITTTD